MSCLFQHGKTAVIAFLYLFLTWKALQALTMCFRIAIMHPFMDDVKTMLDAMQDGNACEFISKLKETWERDP